MFGVSASGSDSDASREAPPSESLPIASRRFMAALLLSVFRFPLSAFRLSPMGQRAVGTPVHVAPPRLRHLADQRQPIEIHRHAETRPFVRERLAVPEVQALGQVLDRTAAVVVL